jgi:hypothetical protein
VTVTKGTTASFKQCLGYYQFQLLSKVGDSFAVSLPRS